MIQTFARILRKWQQTVSIILGFGAVSGWGMVAVASHSTAATERQLHEQIADLQTSQMRLLSERDQLQSAVAEVTQLRQQLRLAQNETAHLIQERAQIQPKPPIAQPPHRANLPATRQPQNVVVQASSTASMHPTPPRAPVRSARTALTTSGSGLLVAQNGSGDGKR